MSLTRPRGLAAVRATFGDERPYRKADGHLSAQWEMDTLARCALPAPLPLGWDHTHSVTALRCHRLLVPVLTEVFDAIHRNGMWARLHTFDGCYADRAIRGAASPSLHSWGIALDLNAATNPLGGRGDMDPSLVTAFEAHGFLWGGRFTRRLDPQHFQFAEGV